MKLNPEDLDDQSTYRHILTISYNELVPFVMEYIGRRTWLTMAFWTFVLLLAGLAINIRINIIGLYHLKTIILHSIAGYVLFPLLAIPVHEFLHVIPYFLSGARNIRIGMDLRQYIFYVTAHRQVTDQALFTIVALTPFIIISVGCILLYFVLPGLWKWSIAVFFFVHTTMCAGDFALLNFYLVNKGKKIYTWDDVDLKEAYFYQEL